MLRGCYDKHGGAGSNFLWRGVQLELNRKAPVVGSEDVMELLLGGEVVGRAVGAR